jgi:alkylation response protein AidB-like acyl-CoA dehydrogenase
MRSHDSEGERRLREEAREWLYANKPAQKRPPDPVDPDPARFAAQRDFDLSWQRTMYEGGWAGVSWPRDYDGRGFTASEQLIWYEEYAAAAAPSWTGTCTWLGLNHAGPTLMHMGTEAQKLFHLPKILKGENAWCQGFSEPNAGSDLASVRTRGEIDGADLVVNGHKIWTSYAQHADYQEFLVRTGPTESRHRGLTWIICDMHTPGIEIRPIKALDGKYHNCEVFYDAVRIPLSNVVGEVGEGWSTAMATLKFERGSAMFSSFCEVEVHLEQLVAAARVQPRPPGSAAVFDDMPIAERLGFLRAQMQSIRSLIYLFNSAEEQSVDLGPVGGILYLPFSELYQQVYRCALDVFGADSLDRDASRAWVNKYFSSFVTTIAGGTSEIQRNVIGERLLGLPR